MKYIVKLSLIGAVVIGLSGCTKQLYHGNYLINAPCIPDEYAAKEIVGRQAINVDKVLWINKPRGGVSANIVLLNDSYQGRVRVTNFGGGRTLSKLSNSDVTISAKADLVKPGLDFFNDAKVNITAKNITSVDYKITKVHKVATLDVPAQFDKKCDVKGIANTYISNAYLVDAEATYFVDRKIDTIAQANLGTYSKPQITVKTASDNKVTLVFLKSWGAVTVEDRGCK